MRYALSGPIAAEELDWSKNNRTNVKYYVTIGPRSFYMSKYMLAILYELTNDPNSEIQRNQLPHIGNQEDFAPTQHQRDIAIKKLVELGIILDSEDYPDSGIALSKNGYPRRTVRKFFVIFNENIIKKITAYPSLLYRPQICLIAIAFSSIFLTLLFMHHQSLLHPISYLSYTPLHFTINQLFISYFVSFGLIISHEIGHASAARHFGININHIGYGVYAVFPTVYSDVTPIWKLSRQKRIIVNLGGIYFNYLFAGLLSAIALFVDSPGLNVVILVCLIGVLFNLLPFVRLDGYWMYVDLTGIHGLSDKTVQLYFNLYVANSWHKKRSILMNTDRALCLYAIGYPVAIIAASYYAIVLYIEIGKNAYVIINNVAHGSFRVENIVSFLMILIYIAAIITFTMSLGKRLRRALHYYARARRTNPAESI